MKRCFFEALTCFFSWLHAITARVLSTMFMLTSTTVASQNLFSFYFWKSINQVTHTEQSTISWNRLAQQWYLFWWLFLWLLFSDGLSSGPENLKIFLRDRPDFQFSVVCRTWRDRERLRVCSLEFPNRYENSFFYVSAQN